MFQVRIVHPIRILILNLIHNNRLNSPFWECWKLNSCYNDIFVLVFPIFLIAYNLMNCSLRIIHSVHICMVNILVPH